MVKNGKLAMPSKTLKNEFMQKPGGYYSLSRPEMIKYVPATAGKVLDIGCGEGLFGHALKHNKNIEIWGIELDVNSAALAKGRIDKVLSGDASVLVGTLPDNYFDCVVFNDVLEHLVDPYSMLEKIKTKLSSDGVIVCSIPNFRHFFTFRDFILSKDWKYQDDGIFDWTHLRFFTLKSIKRMFETLDYDLVTIEGLREIQSWKFKVLDHITLGYLADTRYWQYACVARPKHRI